MYIYNEVFSISCIAISTSGTTQPAIEFNGNRAYHGSGQNLFGRNPNNCVPPPFNGNDYVVIRTFGTVGSKCNQTVISSEPLKVVPCDGFCINTSDEARHQHLPPLFPGQEFNLTLAAIGQDDGLTHAIILFRSNDIFFLSQSHMTKSIKAQCTTVTLKLILKTFTSLAIVNITIADEECLLSGAITTNLSLFTYKYYHVLQALECRKVFAIVPLPLMAWLLVTSPTEPSRGKAIVGYLRQTAQSWSSRIVPLTIVTTKSLQATTQANSAITKEVGLLCGDCLARIQFDTGLKRMSELHRRNWQKYTRSNCLGIMSCWYRFSGCVDITKLDCLGGNNERTSLLRQRRKAVRTYF